MRLSDDARGLRYDRALADGLAALGQTVSVREIRQALRLGRIRVDGRRRAPGDRVRGGEQIDLTDFVARADARVPPNRALLEAIRVVHEDRLVLVLDKPSGMPCQPLRSGDDRTLLSAAIALAPGVASAGPPFEGGLAHRLDVGTSGLVIFAKNSVQRRALRDAFSRGHVKKRYLALVHDPHRVFAAGRRVLDGAIRAARGRGRVSVVAPGTAGAHEARSAVEVRGRSGALAWLQVDTSTGRRHQVRAHLAAAGAPIVHDVVYGGSQSDILSRLALHASRIRLNDGRLFEAEVTGELAEVTQALFRGVS